MTTPEEREARTAVFTIVKNLEIIKAPKWRTKESHRAELDAQREG